MICMKKKKSTDRHLQKVVAMRFPEEIHALLERMSSAEERTKTAVMIRAIRLYAEQGGYKKKDAQP